MDVMVHGLQVDAALHHHCAASAAEFCLWAKWFTTRRGNKQAFLNSLGVFAPAYRSFCKNALLGAAPARKRHKLKFLVGQQA